jgi:hypothetical protein
MTTSNSINVKAGRDIAQRGRTNAFARIVMVKSRNLMDVLSTRAGRHWPHNTSRSLKVDAPMPPENRISMTIVRRRHTLGWRSAVSTEALRGLRIEAEALRSLATTQQEPNE